jgi:RsiW-degrading membrane proteinase PrsW (M82 family)
MYLIIPALFIASLNYFAVEVTYGNNDQDGDTTTIKVKPLPLRLAFYAYLIFLGIRGRMEKRKTRNELMTKLYREQAAARGEEVDPNQMARYLHQHRLDVLRAHSSYSCCYTHDLPLDGNNESDDVAEEDCCSRFWYCLSMTFWNACCGMWCQCYSACAIAQEEREIERLTGNVEPKMDYITFQPFVEYFPAIQDLNTNQISSFREHARAISKLSVKLLKHVAAVLAILVLFALSDIDKNFTFANMIVLLLTLFQAFFLEYLIWWRKKRFDISFDSVIKFFACGFLLTTPMALFFELIVSIVTGLFSMIAMIFILVEDSELLDKLQTDPKQAEKDLAVGHPLLFIFKAFLNAFVIAALCEEMIKYFGYWMVVTPDLLPQKRSNDTVDENEENTAPNMKSVSSTGSGIMVAMCSVALGFACCEVSRCIFIHALAYTMTLLHY